MLRRVRVVRLQMPNNMPQNAYMEHTVFPYSHLCRRARGCENEKEDGAKQRQRRKINDIEGETGKREKCMSITHHMCELTGNHTANQPYNYMNHDT